MCVTAPHTETFGLSDIGLTRQRNEDAWAEMREHGFFVLADGMGGHVAGDVASRESVLHFCDAIDRYFRKTPPTGMSVDAAQQYLKETFSSANSWIRTLGRDYPELSGMGTTLCCLLILQEKIIIAHTGDSRVYRLNTRLSLLTKDHAHSTETSNTTPSQRKTVLTKALGVYPSVTPDFIIVPRHKEDLYLLCTDGLHNVLSHHSIEQTLQSHHPLKEQAQRLLESAKKAGSRDNITLLLVRIGT